MKTILYKVNIASNVDYALVTNTLENSMSINKIPQGVVIQSTDKIISQDVVSTDVTTNNTYLGICGSSYKKIRNRVSKQEVIDKGFETYQYLFENLVNLYDSTYLLKTSIQDYVVYNTTTNEFISEPEYTVNNFKITFNNPDKYLVYYVPADLEIALDNNNTRFLSKSFIKNMRNGFYKFNVVEKFRIHFNRYLEDIATIVELNVGTSTVVSSEYNLSYNENIRSNYNLQSNETLLLKQYVEYTKLVDIVFNPLNEYLVYKLYPNNNYVLEYYVKSTSTQTLPEALDLFNANNEFKVNYYVIPKYNTIYLDNVKLTQLVNNWFEAFIANNLTTIEGIETTYE